MKYTLITGASSGIGNAMAHKFASEGHNLIVNARRTELLEELKQELEEKYPVQVIVKPADLSKEAEAFYESVKAYDIDVFVNNAGFGDYAHVWDADIHKVRDMIDINIQALTTLSLLYVKDYKDKEATLINVSSGLGYFIGNFAVPYSATKFYVSAFTEGIANNLALKGKKMRAKVLAPAATDTDFVAVAEKGGTIKMNDLITEDAYISAEQLAEYSYDLYKSEKVVGKVNGENGFDLKDVIYPHGM